MMMRIFFSSPMMEMPIFLYRNWDLLFEEIGIFSELIEGITPANLLILDSGLYS